MANILYKVFRGDELMKINVDTASVENIYLHEHNQRLYGTVILIKEAGILIDNKDEKQDVEAGDVVFLNYDYAIVIKSKDLYNVLEVEIQKRNAMNNKEADCDCISEAKSLK